MTYKFGVLHWFSGRAGVFKVKENGAWKYSDTPHQDLDDALSDFSRRGWLIQAVIYNGDDRDSDYIPTYSVYLQKEI